MKNGWPIKTLGEVLQQTETVNPLRSPQTEFDYIDVSSISNATFQIETTQRLEGKDAPSRARKLVRSNDILFATIRPTLQRIAIVPAHLDRQVCSTGYFVLRAKSGIDHRFCSGLGKSRGDPQGIQRLSEVLVSGGGRSLAIGRHFRRRPTRGKGRAGKGCRCAERGAAEVRDMTRHG